MQRAREQFHDFENKQIDVKNKTNIYLEFLCELQLTIAK